MRAYFDTTNSSVITGAVAEIFAPSRSGHKRCNVLDDKYFEPKWR
ncbi:hypothetical protein CAEBREN_04457 [Caenorhabditis brenneri]|uniref:Uncharacterized protein n=1 Tax=Caenorhabditis brenneri TaxID=135651 RepID=G0MD00_CAEBE|nr:hypothetical protein CAEBREN_04457 [Caenorhabditis brenneri]